MEKKIKKYLHYGFGTVAGRTNLHFESLKRKTSNVNLRSTSGGENSTNPLNKGSNLINVNSLVSDLTVITLQDMDLEETLFPEQLAQVRSSLVTFVALFFSNVLVEQGFYSTATSPFEIIFQWFFSNRLGSYLKQLLEISVVTPTQKELFKTCFLGFQTKYKFFINRNRPIKKLETGLTYLFYKNQNLINLVFLLITLYQTPLKERLSKQNLYVLVKTVVRETKKVGTYRYINALLTELNSIETPSSLVIVLEDLKILLKKNTLDPGAPESTPTESRGPALPGVDPIGNFNSIANASNSNMLFTQMFGFLVQILFFGFFFFMFGVRNSSTTKPVWANSMLTWVHPGKGTALPLAAMSMRSQLASKPQRANAKSRKVVKTLAARVTPLDSMTRKCVVVYMSDVPSYEQATSGKTPVIIQSLAKTPTGIQTTQSEELIVDYRWVVNEEGLYELKTYVEGEEKSLSTYLLERTALGEQSEFRNVQTRCLNSELIFLDPQGLKDIEISLCLNYEQASKKPIGHLQEWIGHGLIDLKQQYPKVCSQLDPKALNFAKTQAAHFVPEKLNNILQNCHGLEATNLTNSMFNGMSSYDNPASNALDYQQQSTQQLLTAPLTEGRRQTQENLSKILQKAPQNVHKLALSVMADVTFETYYEGRTIVAQQYCDKLRSDLGFETLLNANPELEPVVDQCCDRVFLYRALMDHCRENLNIVQKNAQELTKAINSDFAGTAGRGKLKRDAILEIIKINPKGELKLEGTNPLMQASKKLDQLILDYEAVTQSMQAMRQFALVNSLTMAALVGLPPVEIDQFVKTVTQCFTTAQVYPQFNANQFSVSETGAEVLQDYFCSLHNYGNSICSVHNAVMETVNQVKMRYKQNLNDVEKICAQELSSVSLEQKKKMLLFKAWLTDERSCIDEFHRTVINTFTVNMWESGELKKINNPEYRDALLDSQLKQSDGVEKLITQVYPNLCSNIKLFLQSPDQLSVLAESFTKLLEGEFTTNTYKQSQAVVSDGLYSSKIQSAYSTKQPSVVDLSSTQNLLTPANLLSLPSSQEQVANEIGRLQIVDHRRRVKQSSVDQSSSHGQSLTERGRPRVFSEAHDFKKK